MSDDTTQAAKRGVQVDLPRLPKARKFAGRHRKIDPGTVSVVGLGRFGSATAITLHDMGVDVVAVDRNAQLVQHYASRLPYVLQLDSTDTDALHQLGIDSITRAVVAMSAIEASIITVLSLAEANVGEIWAKARTRTHGQILERVGAHHVVYPERSAGERVGHAVAGHMIDYFEFEDGFAIARTDAPTFTWGRSLAESEIRGKYNVTVVGLKRMGEDFTYAVPETVVDRDDELVVSGRRDLVEAFARLV